MTQEQVGFLAVCAVVSIVGLAFVGLGALAARRWGDAGGWVILFGLACFLMGPLMLIGFPA